jgi:cation transport regulator ChaB
MSTRIAFGRQLPRSATEHVLACARFVRRRERELAEAFSPQWKERATRRLDKARAELAHAVSVAAADAQRRAA